jgi:hypothetical protein
MTSRPHDQPTASCPGSSDGSQVIPDLFLPNERRVGRLRWAAWGLRQERFTAGAWSAPRARRAPWPRIAPAPAGGVPDRRGRCRGRGARTARRRCPPAASSVLLLRCGRGRRARAPGRGTPPDPGRGPAPGRRTRRGTASFIDTYQRDREELPRPDLPIVVGLDGGYVHSSQQRSRTDGWFEVIAGKAIPQTGGPHVSGTCRPTTPNPNGACSKCSNPRGCRPTSRSPSSPTAAKTSATSRSISTPRLSTCWTGST